MITFHEGRLPAHPEATHPRLKISPFMRAVAAPPAQIDWYSNVAAWPMYLNNEIGDCTEAMVAHEIGNASAYASGATVILSDQDVLDAYERVSGYNPDDPSTDRGAVLQDVYSDWRKQGVGGHKNLVFAQVDHTNHDEVKTAVEHFGAVGIGIVVTQRMMDAFNSGRAWGVSDAHGAPLGGHAIPAVGYDAQFVYFPTWGKIQAMTWDCFDMVTDEAWIAVLPEWFDTAGHDPEGLDLHGLGEAFAALTGQANPFPAPTPTPVPPGPVVTADEALAAAAGPWLNHRHSGTNRKFADAVQAWLDAKGL